LSEKLEVGSFELGAEVEYLTVQQSDALGSDEAGLDREREHGFDQVVVSTGAHALQYLVGVAQSGDQHDVDVAAAEFFADPAAQFRSVNAGHHPVGEQHIDILGGELFPRAGAVGGDEAFVAEFGGGGFEHEPAGGVVICDQDAHVRCSR